ncbi:nischarin [Protopterus annectens]|uniref:nischarin n=1 Tax=Protopterus annectens TaxID=7888 RepID=UPI001CFBED45|nr:nischarin [Protopterus annectens]
MDAAAAPFTGEASEPKVVRITGSELVDNYTVYIINVYVGIHQWMVKHRYSDFHDLHEKLTTEKKINKNLLPPKKIIGKNSKSLVEKRQKELEVYLQTLLKTFPFASPKVLSCFLNFNLYEINGITATLAEELFHKGEQLLVLGEVFEIRPLQLYAITQQLRQAKPTNIDNDAKTDLGHILDFTCRLRYLKITGTRGRVGSSTIEEQLLPFDLSIFKSLLQVEINNCDAARIKGLPSLKPTLSTMSIHFSVVSMKDILVPEAAEFEQWEVEGLATELPVAAVIPAWKMLTTLDMSHNQISSIDESVKVIPKAEFLDLSHNEISLLENLQFLYNLIHVDLSYNKLTSLEGAHAKLGNIKTLNLAGNLLESLSGLSKLYSLVNLDLSNNRVAQIEEIKHVGGLPCLEKIILSNNPLSIIPDYRTKVLVQFGDRASEVCLDNTVTTEKEMDTVAVLKAIQKSKETKNWINNSDRKIIEDCRLTAAAGSNSNCSYLPVPPSSPPLSHPASSSQEIICTEEALVSISAPSDILTPKDPTVTQTCMHTSVPGHKGEEHADLQTSKVPAESIEENGPSHVSFCRGERAEGILFDPKRTAVLPFSCVSYTASNHDLVSRLSEKLDQAYHVVHDPSLKEKQSEKPVSDSSVEEKYNEKPVSDSSVQEKYNEKPVGDSSVQEKYKEKPVSDSSVQEKYNEKPVGDSSVQEKYKEKPVGDSSAPPEEDDYFEMGLCEGGHILDCTGSLETSDSENVGLECSQEAQVLWGFIIQTSHELRTFASCVMLTSKVLAVFQILHHDLDGTTQSILRNLHLTISFPYKDLVEVGFQIPEVCLLLRTKDSNATFHILSDSQNLKDFYSSLCKFCSLNSVSWNSRLYLLNNTLQEFFDQLIALHPFSSCRTELKGCFPVYLLQSKGTVTQGKLQQARSPNIGLQTKNTSFSDICSTLYEQADHNGSVYEPCLILLTAQHVFVIKVDFCKLSGVMDSERMNNAFKLHRFPLASLLLHPKYSSTSLQEGTFSDIHVIELLIGHSPAMAVFVLPHEKFHFLRVYSLLRTCLQDVKTIVVFETPEKLVSPKTYPLENTHSGSGSGSSPDLYPTCLSLPCIYPSEVLLQKLTEENHCPSYLSRCPSLQYAAECKGKAIVDFFHCSVAEVENEELRHLMWSSVLFYKMPNLEVSSCVLLSTKAIYFILEDSAAEFIEQTDFWNERSSICDDSGYHLSHCFVLKLNDVVSVNVGLFDQYFRIAGPSADHIVTCLTRDSYSTHAFIQQLMAVLSLLARTPSPEPVEKDFYSEFGDRTAGKMENYEFVHSSRVKFIYPSEEEIGDLAFLAAEKMNITNSTPSLNILLYVLVFQVSILEGNAQSNNAVLHPKTLILTSTDMFLFNEDYICYPVPEFAKEPPQREKYQLTDARRIRDLDRVLLGYQTYPQALTLAFDDVQNQDLMCSLTVDHFGEPLTTSTRPCKNESRGDHEVQWCIFVPSAESREKMISLLARQWEILCSRELPLELTG